MNWITELQHLNYIAVAVATITSYLLGFTWYHWAVFGEKWANTLGLSKEEADKTEGLGGALIISLISGFTKALTIALLMQATNTSGLLGGALFGAIISAIFIVTSLGYYNGFARMSPTLTKINSSHSMVEITLIGAVIGAIS